MINYLFTKQFLSFFSVGVLSAGVNWLSRIIISNVSSFSVAIVASYFLSLTLAFFLNSYFVFPKSKKSKAEQCKSFFMINLLFFPIVWSTSIILEKMFNDAGISSSEMLGHGVALGLPAIITFFYYKFITFKDL